MRIALPLRVLIGAAAVALTSNCAGNTAVAPSGGALPLSAPLSGSRASALEIATSPLARLEDGTLHDTASCPPSLKTHGAAAFDASTTGTLFVADYTATGPIEEYDGAGDNQNPLGSIVTGLNTPYGLWIDPSGTLYVANYNDNNVLEYPQGTSSPSLTISYQVLYPLAVGTDPSGNLYVVNDRGGPIVIYPPGGTMPSSTLGGFYYPTDVAWDTAGNLYVVDHLYGTKPPLGAVLKFAPGSTKAVNLKLTKLDFPVGIVIDSANNIYVTNLGNNTMVEFAPGTTKPKRTITDGICDPVYMALNSSNDLFVANNGTTTVTMYKPQLKRASFTLTKDVKNTRGLAVNPNWQPGKKN